MRIHPSTNSGEDGSYRDLADYPDDAFDCAILSLTIQATRQPKTVLRHLLRIGRRAIVSFPNFGHWQVRAQL
ncbi:MAG TPA: methionine biosynthesis protein MetW, partial [Hyphomicrobiaceae bacterium]|nr:methionine biosynthesis protein MetW [Hyphomicrobiaceae bacterium]